MVPAKQLPPLLEEAVPEPNDEDPVKKPVDVPVGGMADNAEVGAVPTTAVADGNTLAVVMQEGQTEGALLPESGG